MNKQEINKTFFEDLHQSQMNEIYKNSIEEARKVILELLLYVQYNIGDDVSGKDEAVTEGLKWIKDNE